MRILVLLLLLTIPAQAAELTLNDLPGILTALGRCREVVTWTQYANAKKSGASVNLRPRMSAGIGS